MSKNRTRLRSQVGALAVDNFFRTASLLGKLHPLARPTRHGVRVRRDVAYAAGGAPWHRLDVYRPEGRKGPLPTVLYVHGGGFRILSKDTHWLMGLVFARAGYLVFNISYRLAPRHRFPAAPQDCAAAFEWLTHNAEAYGADLDRLVFAGESAGANLVTALTVMTNYRRDEPWARRVFDLGLTPKVLMPYCGMLQVSDAERFRRRKPSISGFINDRLLEVTDCYLGDDPATFGSSLDLADPVCLFERGDTPERPLPPCFATVGTKDPLLPDTRRLQSAYERLGGRCEAVYYPGEVHAFHAMVFRPNARKCWRDSFRFLHEHLPPRAASPHVPPPAEATAPGV
jgi:acetyl esterase